MSNYDTLYTTETHLFGQPYTQFTEWAATLSGGEALDIGCGQGRDALMLAQHGLRVTGVDASAVGIEQMLARANECNLHVSGVVADFYTWPFPQTYDLIVLDSILHFAADKAKENELMARVFAHTRSNGHVVVFIHKSPAKEKALHALFANSPMAWTQVQAGYIDYVYEEKDSGFQSAFQFYMLIMQRRATAVARPNPAHTDTARHHK